MKLREYFANPDKLGIQVYAQEVRTSETPQPAYRVIPKATLIGLCDVVMTPCGTLVQTVATTRRYLSRNGRD